MKYVNERECPRCLPRQIVTDFTAGGTNFSNSGQWPVVSDQTDSSPLTTHHLPPATSLPPGAGARGGLCTHSSRFDSGRGRFQAGCDSHSGGCLHRCIVGATPIPATTFHGAARQTPQTESNRRSHGCNSRPLHQISGGVLPSTREGTYNHLTRGCNSRHLHHLVIRGEWSGVSLATRHWSLTTVPSCEGATAGRRVDLNPPHRDRRNFLPATMAWDAPADRPPGSTPGVGTSFRWFARAICMACHSQRFPGGESLSGFPRCRDNFLASPASLVSLNPRDPC